MAFPEDKPHSLTHSLIYHSLIQSHSLTRSRSLMHLLTHSLVHPSPTHSFSFTHSFTLLMHSFTHSLIHHPLIYSHSLTYSFTQLFPHTFTLSLMHSLIFTHFIHSLTHSTGISNADCAQLCSGCWDRTVHENRLMNHLEPWETNIRASHD